MGLIKALQAILNLFPFPGVTSLMAHSASLVIGTGHSMILPESHKDSG